MTSENIPIPQTKPDRNVVNDISKTFFDYQEETQSITVQEPVIEQETPANNFDLFYIALVLIFIYLITRQWVWYLIFLLGTLASFFAMLASIIHFQILNAVGFCVLTGILGSIAQYIYDDKLK